MADSSHKLFFLLFSIFFSHTCAYSYHAPVTVEVDVSFIRYLCATTPFPELCLGSLSVSISKDASPNPNINRYLVLSLETAISKTTVLISLFNNVGYPRIVEKQRGAVRDCQELHQSSLDSLEGSVSGIRSSNLDTTDVAIYLSAVLTNMNTCLEGLDSATGTMKPALVKSVVDTYKHVSNSLAILFNPEMRTPENNPLKADSKWPPSSDQRFFQDSDWEDYDPNEALVVAADGTGNFRTITEAINFAPNNSDLTTVIYVKEGIYEENVEIPSSKTNIMMRGAGSDVTSIIGNRRAGDAGWTTFSSATLGEALVPLYDFCAINYFSCT